MGDRVRRWDNSRWGVRTIWPGGRVKWLGRWYRIEDGPLSREQFAALPHQERTHAKDNTPRYDGAMDWERGLFYTYGDHHAASKDHVYLHSVEQAEWPGPQCVDGYFVWDAFAVEPGADQPKEDKP